MIVAGVALAAGALSVTIIKDVNKQ